MPDQTQLQQLKDAEIKSMLVDIHRLYVEYTLNPFNTINAKIESRRFDEGISELVFSFNSAALA